RDDSRLAPVRSVWPVDSLYSSPRRRGGKTVGKNWFCRGVRPSPHGQSETHCFFGQNGDSGPAGRTTGPFWFSSGNSGISVLSESLIIPCVHEATSRCRQESFGDAV